ncbi:MAG: hypothetical protein ACI86M_000915 [Saprospiraceae bacterium]|jgi:hypothetical protein
MKKLLLLAIFSTISLFTFAQQETIFNKANNISGWGGPMLEISSINGETVVDVGGGGALIIDNFFFGGYGLGTDAPNVTFDMETYDVDFSHGGLWLGYTAMPNKVVHIYSSLRFGWGDVTLRDGDGDKEFSDNMTVISPEVGVELNITSWFRLDLTGGYRFVNGVDALPLMSGLNDDSFTSPFAAITFRFGGFGDWDDYDDNKDDDFDSNFDF